MAGTMAGTVAPISDEDLAEAVRNGDRAAYATLVERYRDLAYACAYAHLRNSEDAEDVVQEAFVKAYEAIGRQERLRSWPAWFFCIVRNLCRDVGRRRTVRSEAMAALTRMPEASRPSPETEFVLSERRKEVQDAVNALPDVLRVPVVMHYAYGMTYQEISVALGIRPSTVVGRLAGALRRLRRTMGGEELA